MNPPGELRTALPNAVRIPERMDPTINKQRTYDHITASGFV